MRDFLRRLVADPRFADTVNDVVLEIGNARYQSLVDDYVNSAVDEDALAEAWLNTTVANQISADVELFGWCDASTPASRSNAGYGCCSATRRSTGRWSRRARIISTGSRNAMVIRRRWFRPRCWREDVKVSSSTGTCTFNGATPERISRLVIGDSKLS